ncbi:MAG: bifunctional phosphoribosyl-AMP cyclohydrolase/phosphoribosyl-ATP diphosphatase HisIE [Leptospirillia bacterium]
MSKAADGVIGQVKWNADGLVPAVAQSATDGRVLMLAWMNAEALSLTLTSGYAHYWSRSRGALWKKGETSGHLQAVREVRLDCDGDTVLLKVVQTGAACHTGQPTCFYRVAEGKTLIESDNAGVPSAIIDRVFEVILERKAAADPESSYVAKLFDKGRDTILKKVAEESGEVLLAAKGDDPEQVVYESADLMFHLLIALADAGVRPDGVMAELSRRFGLSGIEEKASRGKDKSIS